MGANYGAENKTLSNNLTWQFVQKDAEHLQELAPGGYKRFRKIPFGSMRGKARTYINRREGDKVGYRLPASLRSRGVGEEAAALFGHGRDDLFARRWQARDYDAHPALRSRSPT